MKNAIDVVRGGRLRGAVHGLIFVVTRSVNGREFRHLTATGEVTSPGLPV